MGFRAARFGTRVSVRGNDRGSFIQPTAPAGQAFTESFAVPSVQDEKNTYTAWGWSWNANLEPVNVTEPIQGYSVTAPDIHGDTEGDDLWTYLQMYRRSGNAVYLNRATAWETYFENTYAGSAGWNADDGFLLDHLYGWGLLLWNWHSVDAGAVAQAEAIGALVESHWNTINPTPGVYKMGEYSLRRGARHLLLATRLAEHGTDINRWAALRDRLVSLWLQSPDWDARGMYFMGAYYTNEDFDPIGDCKYTNAAGCPYQQGARTVPSFHITMLMEAFYHVYRTTGNENVLARMKAMAAWVKDFGLDPTYNYVGKTFGYTTGGVTKFHSYSYNVNPVTFWDPVYTTSLVNTLVYGYKLTGDATYLTAAKNYFNRGAKGIYGSPTAREAADTVVGHFVDTRFASATGNQYLDYNKGELQYTYRIFENGGTPAVVVNAIDLMTPNTWMEVANSRMAAAAYPWNLAEYPGSNGFPTINGIKIEGVMNTWNGGAYDTNRHNLIVWGGGHFANGNNEPYGFNIDSLTWAYIRNPTPVPLAQDPPPQWQIDGSPTTKHSYYGLAYDRARDKFYIFPGVGLWVPQTGNGTHETGEIAALNLSGGLTGTWEHRADLGTRWSQAAYDPVTKNFFVKAGDADSFWGLIEYNPDTNIGTNRGNSFNRYVYYAAPVIDPIGRKFYGFGAGEQYSVSLNSPYTMTALSTTGDQTIVNASAPGLVYDPIGKRLIGWAGGSTLYQLNLSTLVWSTIPLAGSNTVTPTAAESTGTYGRFQYIPSKHAVVVVNSVNENVFIRKLAS